MPAVHLSAVQSPAVQSSAVLQLNLLFNMQLSYLLCHLLFSRQFSYLLFSRLLFSRVLFSHLLSCLQFSHWLNRQPSHLHPLLEAL